MSKTLVNLQALRGLACLMVFFTHLANWEAVFGMARPLLKPLQYFGLGSVDVFFVLSGFVIAYTQDAMRGRPAKLGTFLFRRFWRVFPPYWAMLLFTLILLTVSHGWPTATAKQWLAWLTLLPLGEGHAILPPAWSLNYELAFYAVFTLLVVLPKHWGRAVLPLWAIAIAAAALTRTWNDFGTWAHAFLCPFAFELLLGCFVAWLTRTCSMRFGITVLALGLAWVLGWWLAYSSWKTPFQHGNDPLERVLTYGPMAACFVYGLVALERRGWAPCPRWLCEIGEGSYPIYLLHAPIGTLLFDATLHWWPHDTLRHLGWLTMMTLVCIGGGYLFHRFLERPLLQLGKKKISTPHVEVTALRLQAADMMTEPKNEVAV